MGSDIAKGDVTTKVSAYIIASNEINKIEDALTSVTWEEEILVVDSYSIDQIVLQVHFEGFDKLRNSAIAATSQIYS